MTGQDLSELSMLDLFQAEAENQVQALIAGLLALERSPTSGRSLRRACAPPIPSRALPGSSISTRASTWRTLWRTVSSPPSAAGSCCARTISTCC
jgi:hypothetical protein